MNVRVVYKRNIIAKIAAPLSGEAATLRIVILANSE